MSDFISQIQSDELTDYRPTEQDWAEYCEYLDSVGYDDEHDDCEGYDPDANHGFQNLDSDWSDCPF